MCQNYHTCLLLCKKRKHEVKNTKCAPKNTQKIPKVRSKMVLFYLCAHIAKGVQKPQIQDFALN